MCSSMTPTLGLVDPAFENIDAHALAHWTTDVIENH